MANLRRVARNKAKKYGLNPRIFVRQINAESGFNPRAVSPAGAAGVAQIMPGTAQAWGVNPLKPRQALDAAAKNMAAYVERYGSYENALRAYNAGPGAIEASKGYAETNAYVQKILGGQDPGGLGKPRQAGGDSGGRSGGRGTPDRVRLGQRTTFDEAGFEQARKASIVGGLIAKRRGTDSILFKTGVLTTAAPSPADFTKTALTSQLVRGTRSQGGTGVSGSTLVIGDSLGVGTVPYLKKLLGGNVVADVATGRSSAAGIAALKQRTRGRDFANIVLDLGTNDMTAQQLAQSIRQARRLAPNAQIIIPTLNGPYATERKNAFLRRIAANDPKVQLVPWHSRSQGKLTDGIHSDAQGYQARARMIAKTMGWAPAQRAAAAPSGGGAGKADGQLLELFWQGKNGINVKNGQRVPQGFVSGHTNHVHAAGSPKEMVRLGKIAQRMGLSVRENPYFDTVDPVHTTGSWHYKKDRKNRGYAIDVSGDAGAMATFAHLVARQYGIGR